MNPKRRREILDHTKTLRTTSAEMDELVIACALVGLDRITKRLDEFSRTIKYQARTLELLVEAEDRNNPWGSSSVNGENTPRT